MEVFRIVREIYSNAITTSGSANRWNIKGQHVLYAGSSRSLSTLKLVVHRGSIVPTEMYKVMVISLPDDDHHYKQIQIRDLPDNWQSIGAYATLQKIGSDWISNQETLILKVPSAVIPFEYNYVINTEHLDYKERVKMVQTEPYFWDNLLL